MTTAIDTRDVCCVALELSKTSWVCAFAAPGESKGAIHKIKAGDTDRLMAVLTGSKARAEQQLGRPLQIVLCYEVGYDGFWLARYLIARAIHTIVFDPASFLMPRRRRGGESQNEGRRDWVCGQAFPWAVAQSCRRTHSTLRLQNRRQMAGSPRDSSCHRA